MKPEMVRSTPPTGAVKEDFIENRKRQSKAIIDWLKLKVRLAVCDCLPLVL